MSPTTNAAPPWLLPLILIVFPIFFVALWSFVCLVLSALGGWGRIAERFPDTMTPAKFRFPMVTGYVGFVSYRNCLKVHTRPEGLHVAVWKIFGFRHRPLLIPWGEIHNAAVRQLLFAENVVFEIGSPPIGKMQLPKKVFEGQPVAC